MATTAHHAIPGIDSSGWESVGKDHQEAATKELEDKKNKKKTIRAFDTKKYLGAIAENLTGYLAQDPPKAEKIDGSVGKVLLSTFSSPGFVASSERQRGSEIGLRRIFKDGSVDGIRGWTYDDLFLLQEC